MKKRTTYEELGVIPYMTNDETYKQAKERLDLLWKQGKHPAQINRKSKRQKRREKRERQRSITH